MKLWSDAYYKMDKDSRDEEWGIAYDRIWEELEKDPPHELCDAIAGEMYDYTYNFVAGRITGDFNPSKHFQKMRTRFFNEEIYSRIGRPTDP